MKRKVKQLQFINGHATINLRHTPRMSLNAIKDEVDITMTETGYFIKYQETDKSWSERFMPLSCAFDVQLYPEEALKQERKTA